jgi:MFS family permease
MTNTKTAVAPTEMGVTAGLLPLAIIIFLGFSTIGIPLPALPLEVTQSLGSGAVTVGWVIGTQSLVTVFSRQFAGRIADARGPKLAVLIGLPLATITGCFYFASTLVADANVSLVLLLIGRVLLGLSESFVLTGAMTWGIARLGVNRAARVMAWLGIAMFGALSIGGPVGAWLMEAWGFRSIAIATMALPLLGLGVAVALPAAQMAAGKREGFFKVVGLIWRHGLALLLGATPYATVISFTTLYFLAHDWAGAV